MAEIGLSLPGTARPSARSLPPMLKGQGQPRMFPKTGEDPASEFPPSVPIPSRHVEATLLSKSSNLCPSSLQCSYFHVPKCSSSLQRPFLAKNILPPALAEYERFIFISVQSNVKLDSVVFPCFPRSVQSQKCQRIYQFGSSPNSVGRNYVYPLWV